MHNFRIDEQPDLARIYLPAAMGRNGQIPLSTPGR